MLSYGWLFFTNLLSSKRCSMTSNPSQTLDTAHLTWDTQTFFSLATSAVLLSKDPEKALSDNPPVVAMIQKKMLTTPEHKFVVNDLSTGRYTLERTVPPNALQPDERTVNQFLNHPTIKKLLDAVLETVDNIPSSVLVRSLHSPVYSAWIRAELCGVRTESARTPHIFS